MSKLKIIILMIALTISSGLYAEEPKGGFYGNIELGAGVSGGKPSGTDVTDDSKKIKKSFRKTGQRNRTIPLCRGSARVSVSEYGDGYLCRRRSGWFSVCSLSTALGYRCCGDNARV